MTTKPALSMLALVGAVLTLASCQMGTPASRHEPVEFGRFMKSPKIQLSESEVAGLRDLVKAGKETGMPKEPPSDDMFCVYDEEAEIILYFDPLTLRPYNYRGSRADENRMTGLVKTLTARLRQAGAPR